MQNIGITISELNNFNIETNALFMNTFLLYDIIEKIDGYNPIIILCGSNIKDNKIKYYNKEYNIINLNLNELDKYNISVILQGVIKLNKIVAKQIKTHIPNIKFILIEYGNPYYIDLSNYLYLGEDYNTDENNDFIEHDAVWISPHFEFQIDYIKTKYNTQNVFICPFIWEPKIIQYKIDNYKKKYNFDLSNLNNIGIFESNILPVKSAIIPTYIAENTNNTNPQIINKLFITNLGRYFKKQLYHNSIKNLNLFKQNKINLVNSAVPIINYIVENKIGTIISHQVYNELNYLYLEALYLKMPLLHNSKMLKKYGYYYPKFDINTASTQLEYIMKLHKNNIEKYNKLADECIYNFSINNPNNIFGYKHLLDKI